MTWNDNIPLAANQILTDIAQMNQNFTALNHIVATDTASGDADLTLTHTLEYGYFYRLRWAVFGISATNSLFLYINGNGTGSWGGLPVPGEYDGSTGFFGAATVVTLAAGSKSGDVQVGHLDIYPVSASDDTFIFDGSSAEYDTGVAFGCNYIGGFATVAITSLVIKVTASGGETFTGRAWLERVALP